MQDSPEAFVCYGNALGTYGKLYNLAIVFHSCPRSTASSFHVRYPGAIYSGCYKCVYQIKHNISSDMPQSETQL